MFGIARVLLICLLAGGCALLGPRERAADPQPDPTGAPPESAESDPASGETAVSDPSNDNSAPALPATTVASLGDVARPGLWMRTPLVTEPMPGRVSDPATGAVAVVELLPLEAAPGAGSRLSLAAYRALNLPLTSLPELRVTAAE